jgi:Xaa-Pro aminopeptidase
MNTPIPMKLTADMPMPFYPDTKLTTPVADFSGRLAQFRYQMVQAGQDAALIFSPVNLRYLFNYSGEALMAVVTAERAVLITDYRFIVQAEQESKAVCPKATFFCRDRDRQSLGQAIASQLSAVKARRVWFEDSDISVLLWRAICDDNGLIEFSPCPPHLAAQRMVKDDWEVAQIEQAAAIADLALARALPMLQIGVSEREFATELEYQLKKAGAEDFSFATILGFAARSALPHALPTDRRLKKGDLVVLDFGAVVNGYRSDMTRSFVCGKASPLQQQMYQVVLEAQQAALDAVRAGISGAALNSIAANILAASPFAKDAGPGLGHGVGLQLHEQPFLGPLCQQLLAPNAVITIEPGIYIADFGGVRIEDDVLVTKTGCRILTKAAKTFELALRE